jgi:glucose-1-phosphate cytidylyltransferase
MKAVILAGGLGSRLSEETETKPKPMVGVGERPILWHIMKIYSAHGINDFVICAGYKGFLIKEYFSNYFLHTSDVTFDIRNNRMEVEQSKGEPWKVTVVDTGPSTQTGGRLKRVQRYLAGEDFCFTYGDGVADVDIKALLEFHKGHGRLATVTAVQPSGRFGAMALGPQGEVNDFSEKPKGDGGWINGGFFIFKAGVLDYIQGDATVLEQEPMQRLAKEGQLRAYLHSGFWHPMDTLRDRRILESLWESGKAPWKTWNE